MLIHVINTCTKDNQQNTCACIEQTLANKPILKINVKSCLSLTLSENNNAYNDDTNLKVPTTPACTWWNRPEEDPSSGKLESTHPSRTSVKYDQVFFGVESIMRVNAASLDIRDATTSTPGTLNDLTTDLIMANNNNILI